MRERLLARERVALHRAIAAALERQSLDGDAGCGRCARLPHVRGGSVGGRRSRYALRAADHALTLCAPREALQQLERAVIGDRECSASAPDAVAAHRPRPRARDARRIPAGERDFIAASAPRVTPAIGATEWAALHALGMLWAARDYERAGRVSPRRARRRAGDRRSAAHRAEPQSRRQLARQPRGAAFRNSASRRGARDVRARRRPARRRRDGRSARRWRTTWPACRTTAVRLVRAIGGALHRARGSPRTGERARGARRCAGRVIMRRPVRSARAIHSAELLASERAGATRGRDRLARGRGVLALSPRRLLLPGAANTSARCVLRANRWPSREEIEHLRMAVRRAARARRHCARSARHARRRSRSSRRAYDIARRLGSATWIRWTGAPLAIALARAGDAARGRARCSTRSIGAFATPRAHGGVTARAAHSASGISALRAPRSRSRRDAPAEALALISASARRAARRAPRCFARRRSRMLERWSEATRVAGSRARRKRGAGGAPAALAHRCGAGRRAAWRAPSARRARLRSTPRGSTAVDARVGARRAGARRRHSGRRRPAGAAAARAHRGAGGESRARRAHPPRARHGGARRAGEVESRHRARRSASASAPWKGTSPALVEARLLVARADRRLGGRAGARRRQSRTRAARADRTCVPVHELKIPVLATESRAPVSDILSHAHRRLMPADFRTVTRLERTIMRLTTLAVAAAARASFAASAPARSPPKRTAPRRARELKWGPAPAIFPAGAQMAVLQGDPGGTRRCSPFGCACPTATRFRRTRIRPTRTSPSISGNFRVGMGKTFDTKANDEAERRRFRDGAGEHGALRRRRRARRSCRFTRWVRSR